MYVMSKEGGGRSTPSKVGISMQPARRLKAVQWRFWPDDTLGIHSVFWCGSNENSKIIEALIKSQFSAFRSKHKCSPEWFDLPAITIAQAISDFREAEYIDYPHFYAKYPAAMVGCPRRGKTGAAFLAFLYEKFDKWGLERKFHAKGDVDRLKESEIDYFYDRFMR